MKYNTQCNHILLSPSMRRAWIEITGKEEGQGEKQVALHAEGVGRNSPVIPLQERVSSRPLREGVGRNFLWVVFRLFCVGRPLREGVGRNCSGETVFLPCLSRPPCGRRG